MPDGQILDAIRLPGDPDLHFWLMRSVGRCIGLSFSSSMDAGRLNREEYNSLVQTCQTCPHVPACQQWLAVQQGDVEQTQAPVFCKIADTLDALKPY